jgi:hypothetical protein
MDEYRRQQIHSKALALLQEAGVTALPVRPIEIAKHLDIRVEPKPATASGASGWLIRNGSEFAIVYATHIDNEGFQNFSIAHELGHYWLDGHPDHVFERSNEHMSRAGFGSADAIEREADYFAACLLMPKPLCAPMINRNVDGMAAVKGLARQCGASLTSAALRYAELGPLPTGVIQCLNGKVEFCASYPLQAHIGGARALPRNAKVPAWSATHRLAEDKAAVLEGGDDSDSSPACDWFPGAEGKFSLIEEVIGLGRFGRTLTVLTVDGSDTDGDDEEDEPERDEPRFR